MRTLQQGQILGERYEVGDHIGAGTAATVYSALDRKDGRGVALKVLAFESRASDRWVNTFIRELKLTQTIRHPNVCQIFDIKRADGHTFLVMELARGGSLRQLLVRHRERSFDARLDDCRAILAGVAAVHRTGIIHRDIKPENVLQMDDGRLVIADLGASVDPVTGAGNTYFAGTPFYMAPEVAVGAAPTLRADVWSLGVLVHEVMFGKRPDRLEDGRARLGPEAPAAAPRQAAVERALVQLIALCLEERPRRRPRDAGEVLRLWERCRAHPRRSMIRAWTKRHGLALLGGAALAFAGALGAGLSHRPTASSRLDLGTITFGPAQPIEGSGAQATGSPEIVGMSSPSLLGVWDQNEDVRRSIMFSVYADPTGWKAARPLDASENADAANPKVASDGAGNAIAAWQQNGSELWARVFSSGTWGSATHIVGTDGMNGSVLDPVVAMDGQGRGTVVWKSEASGRSRVLAARFEPGRGFGDAVALAESQASSRRPEVAADGDSGVVFVVWQDGAGKTAGIQSIQFVPGQGWRDRFRLDTGHASATLPEIVTAARGGAAYAVWMEGEGASTSIVGRRYDARTRAWGQPTRVDASSTGEARYPEASLNTRGDLVVTWDEAEGGAWARYAPAGEPWGRPQRLDQPGRARVYDTEALLDAAGRAVVVWEEQRGSNRRDVFVSSYEPGSGWRPSQRVSDGENAARNGQIGLRADGRFAIIWSQSDGRQNIWTRLMEKPVR